MKKEYLIGLLRLFGVLLQLVSVKITTHYLTIAELGQFFYLSALSYTANALILVPIDFYQQSKAINFLKSGLPLKSILQINIFATNLSFIFMVILSVVISLWSKVSLINFVEIYLLALLSFFCLSQRNFLNNLGNGIFVVSMLLFEILSRIIFFLLLKKIINNIVDALLFAVILSFIFEFIIIMYVFYKKKYYDVNNQFLINKKHILKAMVPVSFSALCNWFQLQFYRLLYQWVGASSISGIYVTVSNVGASGTSAVSSVYSQLYLPKVYQSKGEFIFSYLTKYLWLILMMLMITLVASPLIIRILTKQELVQYSFIMLFGILTESSNTIIGAMTVFITIISREKLLFKANLIGVLSCGFGFSLIILMKLYSSVIILAIPMVASQLLVCIFLYLELNKCLKLER